MTEYEKMLIETEEVASDYALPFDPEGGYDNGLTPLRDSIYRTSRLEEPGDSKANQLQAANDQAAFLYAFKRWQKHKVVYDFNPAFLDALYQTEDAPVHLDMLRGIPYNAMFLNAPYRDEDEVRYQGALVTVELHESECHILTVYMARRSDGCLGYRQAGLWIHEGQTMEDAIANAVTGKGEVRYDEDSVYTTIAADPLQATEKFEYYDRIYRAYLHRAIQALYYLSAENADVKTYKPTPKNRRPRRFNGLPLNVKAIGVGMREGIAFEELLRREREARPKSTARRAARTNAVRTHVRRAHWHHYWVGEGRSRLALKWLAPTIVNPDGELDAVSRKAGYP